MAPLGGSHGSQGSRGSQFGTTALSRNLSMSVSLSYSVFLRVSFSLSVSICLRLSVALCVSVSLLVCVFLILSIGVLYAIFCCVCSSVLQTTSGHQQRNDSLPLDVPWRPCKVLVFRGICSRRKRIPDLRVRTVDRGTSVLQQKYALMITLRYESPHTKTTEIERNSEI